MTLLIIFAIIIALLLAALVSDVSALIKYEKHQRKWDAVKENRIRIDPDVSTAELCELYVEFCDNHDCKVEF